MAGLVAARQRGEGADTLLVVEHPPVITLGSRGSEEHVLDAGGIPVRMSVGRGGDVTYHGPGQLVGYPIIALTGSQRDLHRYLRGLEQTLIDVLADHGLVGERVQDRTGVWVQGAKVAAIGVRVARWVTSHGFSLNLTTEVHEGFRRIVPCGITGAPVTSMEELLGAPPDREELEARLVSALERVLV